MWDRYAIPYDTERNNCLNLGAIWSAAINQFGDLYIIYLIFTRWLYYVYKEFIPSSYLSPLQANLKRSESGSKASRAIQSFSSGNRRYRTLRSARPCVALVRISQAPPGALVPADQARCQSPWVDSWKYHDAGQAWISLQAGPSYVECIWAERHPAQELNAWQEMAARCTLLGAWNECPNGAVEWFEPVVTPSTCQTVGFTIRTLTVRHIIACLFMGFLLDILFRHNLHLIYPIVIPDTHN